MGHTIVQIVIYTLLSIPAGILVGMGLGMLGGYVVNLFTDDLG